MKIKEITVSASPPNTNKSYVTSRKLLDIRGNIIDRKSYEKGLIRWWNKYVYDENNKLIEETSNTVSGYTEDYIRKTARTTKFNTSIYQDRSLYQNKKIEEIDDKGQKIISSFFGRVNKDGVLSNRKFLNENNVVIEEHEYTKGKLTKKTFFNENGDLLEVRKCIDGNEFLNKTMLYDEKGNLLEERKYRDKDTPLNYTLYKYDGNSQKISEKHVTRNGRVNDYTIFRYNTEGLLIETVDYPLDENKAYADVEGTYTGYAHKYYYNSHKLKETDNLYHFGELVMVYKYTYEFWP